MSRMGLAFVIGIAAAVAVSIAGCAGGTKLRDIRAVLPHDARVVGVARPCGETTSVCYGINTVSVSVISPSGHVASTIALTRSDRFSFILIPGRYTVVLNVNGGDLAQAPASALPHKTTYIDLVNPHIH